MALPNIPIPAQARREQLHKAIWDYLRTGLSYEEASAAKGEAEGACRAALDEIIERGKQQ